MSELAANGAARVALVTGANRGIGFEVARQLARQGMMVMLGARDPEKGEKAAERLREEGLDVLPKKLDVSDKLIVDHLAADIEEDPGRLDVLVNNAAILYDTWQRTERAENAR
jgi:NAD(P)-dependent dehydrogenase (short-subunit alcohol dehydrogenase family)